jgi:outer membrane receptor protein involved in Fe transport
MTRPSALLAAVSLLALASVAGSAHAETVVEGAPASPAPQDVVVTAHRLNDARESIQPSLGATTYSVDNAAIQALPGGDNQQLNQVVLQLPGVVQDGFGQLHIRDDHNGIQYRLNGVILPEGIAVFGQTLSPRLVGKLSLITGAMPAQYGLRTAGVIDISTKSGLFDNGGQVSIYGGSHGTYEPSFEYGSSVDGTNLFVSADFKRTQLGIESTDGSSTPNHDRSDQGSLFVYGDRNIGQNDRVSVIAGYSNQRFQIPNPVGLEPDGMWTLNGSSTFPSQNLDETQRETTGYGIASWLHDEGKVTLQTSLFTRYSTLTYRPDVTGELLFNGIAEAAEKKDFAVGLQSEGVYRLNDAHTLRGGVILQGERATSNSSTEVFPVNAAGAQSGAPITIADKGGKDQFTYSLYLQDEWKLAPQLVLNYGLRFDDVNGYRDEMQLSPRVNAVWTPLDGMAVHAGYARYFTPPPFELVGSQAVAKVVGTSAAPANLVDDTPRAERQNYYDLGLEQKFGGALKGLTLGVDGYYRTSTEMLDEGQFGAPIILTPFNYQSGTIKGVEFSANYSRGPISAYANFAIAKAQGQNIASSQFNFDPADLAYIKTHPIYLDHDQTYTASAGAAYKFDDGVLRGSSAGFDLLYGSGLRKDGDVPNGDALPDYIQVNLSVSHKWDMPVIGKLEGRLDVINVFDKVYEIRDGTGVGVGAPQYGPRRGFFVGMTKEF